MIEADVLGSTSVTDALVLVGQTPVALLLTVLAAIVTIGRRGRTLSETQRLLDDALGPICSIILITGAGGCSAACCAPAASARP